MSIYKHNGNHNFSKRNVNYYNHVVFPKQRSTMWTSWPMWICPFQQLSFYPQNLLLPSCNTLPQYPRKPKVLLRGYYHIQVSPLFSLEPRLLSFPASYSPKKLNPVWMFPIDPKRWDRLGRSPLQNHNYKPSRLFHIILVCLFHHRQEESFLFYVSCKIF